MSELTNSIRRNRQIIPASFVGLGRGLFQRPAEFRHHVARDAWTIVKRFGATQVQNIELREIPSLEGVTAEGFIDDYQRLVVAALVKALGSRSFFEIGTNRGRTAWTVARTNPDVQLYTLDAPPGLDRAETRFALAEDDRLAFRDESCGEAFRGTPEANRITQLWGDSAVFDYSSYQSSIDFVYIDGAHTYDYVVNDSKRAFEMLSESGVIGWDDYTTGVGVYQAIGQIAQKLDRPVYHLFGTRMALYSRGELVIRLAPSDFASLPAL